MEFWIMTDKIKGDDLLDLTQSVRFKLVASLMGGDITAPLPEEMLKNPDLDIVKLTQGLLKDMDSTELGRMRLAVESKSGDAMLQMKEMVGSYLAQVKPDTYMVDGANVEIPVPVLPEREYVQGEKDVGLLVVDMEVIDAKVAAASAESDDEEHY